eukprot:TRINITY_DN43352_c0_g1_i1.p1 TRINITY_DN43352_c0_g1~~TRINITY_DN43352_c0_g1_i1.p1  ORF type:complete len:593 (-),score=76.17 TRINITY_DN43352_c0_g1_i1:38-1816(-)
MMCSSHVLPFFFFAALASAGELPLFPQAYQFEGENYGPWPENDLPELQHRESIGLAFSGGGTRAQIAALGQLNGLEALGILKHAKYITGISGGSWASAAFAYAKASSAEFLGDFHNPENITMALLGNTTEGAGRFFAVNNNLIEVIAANLLRGYNIGEIWYRSVSQVFLEPAGVKWGSFFSWSDREVADIMKRNPALAHDKWATVRDGAPFLIVTATLTGPVCSNFISQKHRRSATLIESTPLYVGEAHTRHEVYHGWPKVTRQIGGYVEPFAFGAMAGKRAHLPAGNLSGAIDDVMTNHATCGRCMSPKSGQCSWPWALGHAVGASSWAPGEFFSEFPLFQALDLDVPYWSPASPISAEDDIGNDDNCGRFTLADGGCTSNLYVSGLIKRGVKTIIAFWNTYVALAPSSAWDPAEDNSTKDHIDDAFASFYGVQSKEFGDDYNQNQMFDNQDFAHVAKALQASQDAGTGAVASVEHTTIANPSLGITAGKKVHIVWFYLSRAYKFEDAIVDPDVKKAAFVNSGSDWDPRSKPTCGTFKNFPYWGTESQLHVNKQQANLMSYMQSWVVQQNADILNRAVAYSKRGANAGIFI